MMQVYVDGALFPTNLRETDPVQAAVDAVRIGALARRRAITSIRLDDRAIPVQEEKELFASPTSAHQKLEVTTEDPVTLALGVLSHLEPFLAQLEQAHEHAAACLHQGRTQEFQKLLLGCVQGWELLLTGVRNLGQLLAGMPAAPAIPVEEMRANVAILGRAVAGLKSSYQTMDPSRLADVLEYDLAERLPYWKQALASLRAGLSR
jgi:hypothetical protein